MSDLSDLFAAEIGLCWGMCRTPNLPRFSKRQAAVAVEHRPSGPIW